MATILAWFADPAFVIGLAILIFVIRVVYLAHRLKAAAAHPSLADLRALEQAKESLDAHRESLAGAREELATSLDSARDILRHYREPLARVKAEKRRAIERSMAGLRTFRDPFEKAQRGRRDALEKAKDPRALREAKALVRRYRPPGSRRPPAPEGAPKDI